MGPRGDEQAARRGFPKAGAPVAEPGASVKLLA